VADPLVSIRVGGRAFTGWTSARVTRNLEALAGSFELGVSDRSGWQIAEEDECSVLIGDQVLLTGSVDRPRFSIGPQEHSLSVEGRDRAGALVDCSAVLDNWDLTGLTLLAVAQLLAQPFGVAVAMQAGLQVPALSNKLAVDPGESAHQALEKACRMAGVLAISDGRGGLVLTRAGSQRATSALVEGENIKAGSSSFDATDRYRRYLVSGQRAGSDDDFGLEVTSVLGSAEDPNVRRSERVLMVRPEGAVSSAQARARAQWEAAVRAARGDQVQVTVQGWTQGDGSVWPINALVPVRSPGLRVDGEMLITAATYALDSGGTTTQLQLMRPDAFKPEPVVPAAGRWRELARGA
jgi:prophage tail gpP-like protein